MIDIPLPFTEEPDPFGEQFHGKVPEYVSWLDLIKQREVEGSSVQGSEGWHKARLGCLTGSKGKEYIPMRQAKGGGYSFPHGAQKYFDEKIMEILTGRVESIPDTYGYMQHGTDMEPLARAFMEEHMSCQIHEVGAVRMPWSDRVAISADGVGIDNEGKTFILETKSPKTLTHIGYCRTKKVPATYMVQVFLEMMALDTDYGMFCSYDDRATHCEAVTVRVERDEVIEARVKEWCLRSLDRIDKGVLAVKNNSIDLSPEF